MTEMILSCFMYVGHEAGQNHFSFQRGILCTVLSVSWRVHLFVYSPYNIRSMCEREGACPASRPTKCPLVYADLKRWRG